MFPDPAGGSEIGDPAIRSFIQYLHDPDLLIELMQRGNSVLRQAALSQYLSQHRHYDASDLDALNERLYQLARQYPDDFVETGSYWPDPRLLALLWDSGRADARKFACRCLFDSIDQLIEMKASLSELLALLKRFTEEEPQQVNEITAADEYGEVGYGGLADLSTSALWRVWDLQLAVLGPAFLPVLAYRVKENPYGWQEDEEEDDENEDGTTPVPESVVDLIKVALAQYPEAISDTRPAHLAAVLPYLDSDELFAKTASQLLPLAAKSKPVQRALPIGLAKVNPRLLDQQGWFGDKRKGVRMVVMETLLASEQATAAEYLQQLLTDKRTSTADQDRIRGRLSESGVEPATVAATDAEPLDLQAQAAKAKIKPQVKKIWSETLSELLAPLDEHSGRWLLSLALEAGDNPLSATAIKLIEPLSREQQAALVEHLVGLWLAANGDRKLRWLLKFIPQYGDDRNCRSAVRCFQRLV